MSTTLGPSTPVAAPPEDEVLTIPGLTWDQYVIINDALGDRPNVRTLFLDGRLTFVSPARVHEWSERVLDTILLVISDECDVDMEVVGSTTLRKGEGRTGLEGDEAYYLRGNVARMGGPVPIDLDRDPPPDLAIEVENTHRATDALAIYAQLGVPEVWRHDVRRGRLSFLALHPDGTYREVSRSLGFPFLTPEDVLFQVRRAEELKSRPRWFRQLRDWVRDEIRPRLDPA